jgi:hypothetical protein
VAQYSELILLCLTSSSKGGPHVDRNVATWQSMPWRKPSDGNNVTLEWLGRCVMTHKSSRQLTSGMQNSRPHGGIYLFRNPLRVWSMPSSGMLRRVALVRTDVLEKRIASIIRLTRIGKLRTTSIVTSNLMMKAMRSSETSALTTAIRRNIPEDGFPHSHRRANLKSYTGGSH